MATAMVTSGASGDGDGGAPASMTVFNPALPASVSDPPEVVGKRSEWEPEQSQLSESVSDGARVGRAPYWQRDDGPHAAETRVDGFAGWDDLPRGFMSAVFEVLLEQTNAHRLVRRGCNLRSQWTFPENNNHFSSFNQTLTYYYYYNSFPSQFAQVMTCGLVCKSWHRDAVETLLRDTAVSGRGTKRFAKGRGLIDESNEARVENRNERAAASDDNRSLQAQKNNFNETEPDSDVDDEEFSSKRRKVGGVSGWGDVDNGGGEVFTDAVPVKSETTNQGGGWPNTRTEDYAETNNTKLLFTAHVSAGSDMTGRSAV